MRAEQVFREYEPVRHWPTDRQAACRFCGNDLGNPLSGAIICASCGRENYANPLPAVCVLVEQDGQVLLVRRREDVIGASRWCLPAGFIEFGEDFLTAGQREVLEETGLDLQVDGIISVVSNFFTPDLHSLVVVLKARAVGGMLKAGDDAVEIGWFDPSKELPPMAFAADDHIIRRYFQDRSLGVPVDPDYSGEVCGMGRSGSKVQ